MFVILWITGFSIKFNNSVCRRVTGICGPHYKMFYVLQLIDAFSGTAFIHLFTFYEVTNEHNTVGEYTDVLSFPCDSFFLLWTICISLQIYIKISSHFAKKYNNEQDIKIQDLCKYIDNPYNQDDIDKPWVVSSKVFLGGLHFFVLKDNTIWIRLWLDCKHR